MNSKKDQPEEGRKQEAKRNLGTNKEIGRKLKQYYDSILTEEIPDRFSQLLGQLEQAEQKSSGE